MSKLIGVAVNENCVRNKGLAQTRRRAGTARLANRRGKVLIIRSQLADNVGLGTSRRVTVGRQHLSDRMS